MVNLLAILWLTSSIGDPPFACGERKIREQLYGKIELRVDCKYIRDNIIFVTEYKGSVQHGISLTYDSLWRLKDSTFFVDGKEHGISLVWDTVGNILGRTNKNMGKAVGKQETFHSAGKTKLIKYYDKNGKEHGPWLEWWPNGNKRKELELSHGQLRNSIEFFPNGKPRLKYSVHFKKISPILYDRKVSAMETWTPDGRPAGKVEKGNGEVLLFQLDGDKLIPEVIHETYRDSLVKGADVLDSLKAYWRLDSLKRVQPGK